ncbi:MAG TPA: protein tyrosine phosphatase family protein, partial [Anaerolineales bacterium]|nr:protein tyrosine phosphatase family protein [Anaerolineales bacterium]
MIEELRNFLRLSEKLISSGMPTAEQLNSAAESGIEVVINLALSTSEGALQDEEDLASALGMKYINIPVLWNNPTRENLDDFMKAMDAHKDSNILVHCQANYRATGFITMDRILRLGWERDLALTDLHKIWNLAEYPIWERF